MIIDNIECLDRYVGTNPLFQVVIDYLASTDLATLPTGVHEIQGHDVYVNIQEMQPRSREVARWESHREMIDIQLLLSGEEEQGWLPLSAVPAVEFDQQNDIAFYDEYEQHHPVPVEPIYFQLNAGQMAIYFPSDVHKPAICKNALRKAIFKVRA